MSDYNQLKITATAAMVTKQRAHEEMLDLRPNESSRAA